MKNLSRPEYSTGEFRLIGAILKMHRFETYRRTERISYPPFNSHFSFQSITGIDLYSVVKISILRPLVGSYTQAAGLVSSPFVFNSQV